MDEMGNKINLLFPCSRRLPRHRFMGDLVNTPTPNWILLDISAYIFDRCNSTTATCQFWGDKKLQVTFFPAHPPQVSYFCVHCVGMSSRDYSMEPRIIAMEGNHVLIRVSFGSICDIWDSSAHEYFIYTASGGGGSSPLVEVVPNPHRFWSNISYRQMGLLSDRDGGYTIVAFLDDSTGSYKAWSLNQYEVCIFSSDNKVWTLKYVNRPMPPPPPPECGEFRHVISKVVTIGGEGGTIAFVDLWHGIMLYDVLNDNASLRYIELPEVISDRNDNPLFYRDIAYVNGHIKFVCMTDTVPGRSEVATWSISMPATASMSQQSSWIRCQSIEVSKIRDEQGLLHREYNKMLKVHTEGRLPTMESLHVGHPTLSLHDDHTVYFMTKVRPMDKEACVVAVDMRSGTIQGAAKFDAQRTSGLNFTYTHSRISSFLNISRYQGRKTESQVPTSKDCSDYQACRIEMP